MYILIGAKPTHSKLTLDVVGETAQGGDQSAGLRR